MFDIFATLRAAIFSLALVLPTSQARACKRTAEAGEAGFRVAVLKEIKSDKQWSGFKVEKIKHDLNVFEVHLKSSSDERVVKFEAVGEGDCQIVVRRIE